ncbi:MAG: DNA helicase UvrD [Gammaproteobacteria bacterium]|nr:MAG: DNA helicase UvrD [Gammaproteobacteria bacterium]
MSKKLILASAGAGKTHRIVTEAIELIKSGGKVLVVTYTINNQKEVISKFKELQGKYIENFHVKGLFTFLLDDLIRPYQNCMFNGRIESINFNESNPNKKTVNRKSIYIKGRQEKNADKTYNPRCYLTSDSKKAHTMFLAKLASRIMGESKGKTLSRLEDIYDHIYFDEVQDLVGWDYDVIHKISKSGKLKITCVGDFRQTIYETATALKNPKTNQEKLDSFNKMGFIYEPMNVSRRSIQKICDFADKIHSNDGYDKTISLVDDDIPEKYKEHAGVFVVKESDVGAYAGIFNPTLLRSMVSSGKQFNELSIPKINFGKSKGLGFNRVLVLPTDNYTKYLSGDEKSLEKGKTDASKNKLYVAITRARYSICFIVKDNEIEKYNIPIWSI